MKKIVCLITVCFLLSGLFTGCGEEKAGEPLFAQRGRTEREDVGDLTAAKDAEAILEALSAVGRSHGPEWEEPEADGAGLQLLTDSRRDGDTVVTDGSYLYMLDSYGLILASAAGAGSEILSYTRVERGGSGWSERIYLGENRVAIVSTVSVDSPEGEGWKDSPQVRVTLLDSSDPRAPQKLAEAAVDGALVDAYCYDGSLYLVTRLSFVGLPDREQAEQLLPRLSENGSSASLRPGDVYLSPVPERTALSLVAALRLEDGRIADALAFTGGVEAVCGEGPVLCLARSLWTETPGASYREEPYTVQPAKSAARTEIKRLALDGTLRLEGGCLLEGALPDPAALSLQNNVLRAATEQDSRSYAAYTDEKHGWTNYEKLERSHSSLLSLLDGSLNVTGSLSQLGGEAGVTACRFVGNNAWMTASAGDERLFTAALSREDGPAMTGSLPAGGDRLLLRPFGENLVLGLAVSDEDGSWQLMMYDLSDPAEPRLADSLKLKDRGPAAGLSDPGAVFSDPGNALIGFPAADGKGEYLLIRWAGSSFKEKGVFELEYLPAGARAMLLDGLLYICSPGEFYVTDPESMRLLATVSNAVG